MATSTRVLLAEQPFLDGLAPSSLDRLTVYAHPVFRNRGHRLFAACSPPAARPRDSGCCPPGPSRWT